MAYRRTPAIQARLDAQRATIVSAAADLLAQHGYGGCSMAAVAARAGVASGTVYRHFASKGELLADLFRTVVSREVDAVRDAAAAPADVPARTAAIIETFAGRALKAPRLAYALLAEPVDPVVDELRLLFRIAFRDVIRAVIADGVAAHELPPQNPTVVAAALVGAIGEALVGPLSAELADVDTVPTLIQFSMRAIGAVDAGHP